MDSTPWYKSKGKIGGLAVILAGATNAVCDLFNIPFRVPLWVFELLIGFTGYGIRDAIKTNFDNSLNAKK